MGTTHASIEELEALAQRANRGDRDAGGEFIAANLSYWMAATRQILHMQHQSDAEDLVQNAIVKLIELWQQEKGPRSNSRAYVVVSIRNSYIDRLRSPRSRIGSLDQLAADKHEPAYEEFSTDLVHERDAVSRAFSTLSKDQQMVLEEVLVQGCKPADLVQRFERKAPAISNLLQRAKQSLRRALLIEYLAEGDIECAENAYDLPKQVHESPDAHDANEPGLRHILTCKKCRRNWRGFASIGLLLGITPLFVAAQYPHTIPALTAAQDSGSDADSRGEQSHQYSASATSITPAAVITPPVNGVLTRVIDRIGPTRGVIAGIVLVAAGAATLLVPAFVPDSPVPSITIDGERVTDNPHGINFDVTLSEGIPPGAPGPRTLTVQLDAVNTGALQLHDLELRFSPGNTVTDVPSQLNCEFAAEMVQCEAPGGVAASEPLRFRIQTTAEGNFTLKATAEIENQELIARAAGDWK
ncbi:sigma-70 family RNA polymerase sigma factor [Leucobacter chromiireducens]|uniref:Sigma-70 family RNA polymerase sigma factor n=1 Tax=Leucobacter chromiireducens subsp. chromiireducens TaxID=660067 RepID=A0ABS1SMS3_9MICO|nr:sigma-70 family RNA polymerase sigma factor [Leucobacter chromiireducens subsp. chromiireducens]